MLQKRSSHASTNVFRQFATEPSVLRQHQTEFCNPNTCYFQLAAYLLKWMPTLSLINISINYVFIIWNLFLDSFRFLLIVVDSSVRRLSQDYCCLSDFSWIQKRNCKGPTKHLYQISLILISMWSPYLCCLISLQPYWLPFIGYLWFFQP